MGFHRRDGSSESSGSDSASGSGKSGSSSSSGGSSSARSRSRSKSKSGSRSKSRSKSKSRSRSHSRSRSRSSSASGEKKSDASKSGKSSASVASNGSGRSKRLLKVSERKASSKLEERLSNGSDSEEENVVDKSEKIKVEKKVVAKKNPPRIENDAIIATWRDEFDDGLDDDLIGDIDDRTRMEEMTEMEREQEFFKRAEKREELKKRFEISQKLKLQLKDKPPPSKQKSDGELSSADDEKPTEAEELEGRKKGYEVKHAAKFSALAQMKAKREEKEKKDRERKDKEEKSGKKRRGSVSGSDSDMEKLAKSGKKKKMKASEIYSSSSDSGNGERRKSSSSSSSSASSSGSSGESDTERHKSKKVVKKALNVTCKEDLEKIRLSRFKIDKFVHLPIFKKTVVGCFVRIGIGTNPEKNIPMYRVAEISDVCETAKVYDVMKSRTNIGLRLNHGKKSKVFRAQFISNQAFTDSEFNKWKQTCLTEHVDLPTFKHVDERLKAIQTALTYRFSSNDVDKILASKEKFAKGPKNYAMAKAKLMKDKVQAQVEGRLDEVEVLDTKLAELEERAEQLDKARTGSLSNIAFINNRNRKGNVERAEQGIREEERRLKLEGKVDDPFTRRKTRPTLSMPKKDVGEAAEMTSELLIKLEKDRQAKEMTETGSVKEKENIEDKKRKQPADTPDIFNAHDFDIDINIGGADSGLALTSIAVKPVTASLASAAQPNKRSLKLEDYKKRKGII